MNVLAHGCLGKQTDGHKTYKEDIDREDARAREVNEGEARIRKGQRRESEN